MGALARVWLLGERKTLPTGTSLFASVPFAFVTVWAESSFVSFGSTSRRFFVNGIYMVMK